MDKTLYYKLIEIPHYLARLNTTYIYFTLVVKKKNNTKRKNIPLVNRKTDSRAENISVSRQNLNRQCINPSPSLC